MVTLFNATNGLPSVKDNERRRQRRFQLSSAIQLFTSVQAEALEREFFVSLECLSTPRIAFANKTQEGNER